MSWSPEHPPPNFLGPISPEGAIPTGQQIVEDIERGLTRWASSHTQLLQKHRLQHGRVWAKRVLPGQAPPTPHQKELGPWEQAATAHSPPEASARRKKTGPAPGGALLPCPGPRHRLLRELGPS